MNKKIIGSLLGGGVTAVVASFVGVKLKNNLDYNKKVGHYQRVNRQFMENTAQSQWIEGYYFPNWDDNVAWGKQHKRLKNVYVASDPFEKWPTFESFRDYCFAEAEKDKEVKQCNGTHGWCTNCIRGKDWG